MALLSRSTKLYSFGTNRPGVAALLGVRVLPRATQNRSISRSITSAEVCSEIGIEITNALEIHSGGLLHDVYHLTAKRLGVTGNMLYWRPYGLLMDQKVGVRVSPRALASYRSILIFD